MTEQEKRIQEQTKDAIEVLGFLKKDFENKAKPRCKFARVRAGLFFGIEALEKQIPKMVRELDDTKTLYCAVCTSCQYLVYRNQRYCDGCGQKLDWE